MIYIRISKQNLHFCIIYSTYSIVKEIIMFNLQVVGQLLSTSLILLSGPVVILLIALKKGDL